MRISRLQAFPNTDQAGCSTCPPSANKLAIDQPEPIVDFVRTTNGRSILEEGEEDFLRFLAAEIAARGRIEVSHDYGLFIARK